MNAIRNFSLSFRSLPVALLILGILSYGIYITWMGFYWDDWPWVWFSEVMGPSGMLKIDIEHRPISGVVLWLGSIIAGDSPLGWQIYNLIWRFLGAVALAWALKGIWPQQNRQIAMIALLFLVYPGFKQQFVAVNNSRHLFPLMTFLISIGLMVRASRNHLKYWQLTGAAILFSIITMFTTEYYYGPELIRPLILWFVIRNPNEKIAIRFTKVIRAWLPYLVPLILVFIWRYVISKSVNYGITLLDDLKRSPVNTFLKYLELGAKDIFDVVVTAWRQILQQPVRKLFGDRVQIYYFGIVALTALGTSIYLLMLRSKQEKASWGRDAITLGFGALLVAPIPFWVTGLDPRLAFPGDRLNLPMIFGACLLLVGLLELLFKPIPLKILVIPILIGLSVGFHFTNAVSYRSDWQHQKELFKQLTWRIPGLKDGTALISNELPLNYSTDNSLVAPINWTYAPEFSSGTLPVYIYYVDLRFDNSHRQIEPGATYHELYRFYPFETSSDQILVIYQEYSGCLRVLDSIHHQFDPTLPDDIRDILHYSSLDQITTTQNAELPAPLQGDPDLENNIESWCYNFEHADLARQREDWEQVSRFGDQAFEKGFPDSTKKHVTEFVVFIEGYAHTGDWQRAIELTLEAYKIDHRMKDMLCHTWERIIVDSPEPLGKLEALEIVNTRLGCEQ